MGSSGSGVPGPTLFLLLVLPPPLLSAGSFQHDGPGWKDLHHLSLDWGNLYRHLIQDAGTFHHLRGPSTWTRKRRAKDENSCQSSFDLYFILDMSGSVNNNWMDVYAFVEDLVKKYDNPNLRISFITYSTLGHTLMKLTSDRNEIRDGLSRLQNIVPSGATHMQEGFKKANEQIQRANSRESKVPSMIISLTDGTLEEAPFEMTKEEADKARKMGATVYCVGVKDFEEDQLLEIADSPHHVFAVDQGFKALKYIIEPLGTKSCIEITAVEPSSVCTGDENELMISGKGFNNAKKKDEVICRFKFSDKQLFDIKAESVKDTSITCPGVKIEKPDQEVFVEVSLNNGVSFINNNVSITSKNCASTREARLDDRNAPPAAQQPPEEPRSSPPPQFTPYVNPLYFCALIPALLLFLLMLWCIWWLCRRKTIKEPPPVQKPERVRGVFGPDDVSMPDVHTHLNREAPCCVWGYDFPRPSSSHLPGQKSWQKEESDRGQEGMQMKKNGLFVNSQRTVSRMVLPRTQKLPDKDADSVFSSSEPEETCQMSCPTVIVPCGCQGGRMKRMEGKLDTLCDFVQHCNQMSLMWCPPRDMVSRAQGCSPWAAVLLLPLIVAPGTGKCLNFALMKPHCGQLHCSPKVCLQPSQECFSVNSCCSRCQYPPPVCSRLPSRMQPLISPPARPCCGATLSLQPP
ncbi:anthrax toxin receptor-like [Orcinus orca]|uniref:anthrax toxin receptor-like n=1 Tax=Orcinus orca TaxID=9733 RepID=UPI0021122A8F|nr:anthrax toxin receptor-like [Orcinus orca]